MENQPLSQNDNAYQSGTWKKPESMRSLAAVFLLSIFTFGIYFLYWVYKVTEYANRDQMEPQHTPVAQMLLVWFIPFYELYWWYKTSKKLSHIGASIDVAGDNSVVTLLLSIFEFDLIGAVILQDQINKLEAVSSGAGINANGIGVCKHCRASFPNDATVCPKCGQPYRKPFTQTVGFAILMVVLVIVLLISVIVGSTIHFVSEGLHSDDYGIVSEEPYDDGSNDSSDRVDDAEDDYGEVKQTDNGQWALVKGDMVNTDFTGIAENQYGLWYVENGYVNFDFSGTLSDDDTTFVVEKGKVVSQHPNE